MIIIDGVNIAECKMLCENYECALHYIELNDGDNVITFGKSCQDNECYFKQMAREKQYNEELKAQLSGAMEAEHQLQASQEMINKYKQALAEIREMAQLQIDFYEGNYPLAVPTQCEHEIIDKCYEVLNDDSK